MVSCKENKLVSVIIPTFNQTLQFERAVNSVILQSYKNIEIIVIDDNNDEKIKIHNFNYINSLNKSNIVYIQNEKNIGSTASRNKGILIAKGEYITFLDDDDEYLENKILNQVIPMIENDVDFSTTNVKLYNEHNKLVDVRKRSYLYKNTNETLFVKHLKYHITSTNTLMFKSSFLKEIGGFDDENLGDEFYLMAKALKNSNKFLHINTCDVKAYIHAKTGLSSTENKIITEKKLLDYKEKYFNELKNKDIKYIKMRHYAVIAYAYKKSNRIFRCITNSLKAFFICPFGFIKLFFDINQK